MMSGFSRGGRQNSHQGVVVNEAISCLHFDYDAICQATNNFNSAPVSKNGNKLGEGGFGPVFKGELHFTEVAIKVLRRTKPVSAVGFCL